MDIGQQKRVIIVEKETVHPDTRSRPEPREPEPARTGENRG